MFYLMRHADTKWPLVNERQLVGAANDLWEPMSAVRQRSLGVLTRYASAPNPIVVVPHSGVIESLTGRTVGLTEILPYALPLAPL